MAEAPNYQPALANADEQRKAVLEAMATGGMAGKKAYEDARSQVQQYQQNAVQAALARAQAIGAPAGAGGSDAISGALDTRLANMAGAQADHMAYSDRMSQANTRYLDQLKGAVPVIQARRDEDYSKAKSETEGEIARRKSDLESAIGIAKQRFEQRQIEDAQERAERERDRAETRADRAATKAKANLPSLDELLGAAAVAQPAAIASQPGVLGSAGKKILGGPRMQIGPGTGANVSQIPAQQIEPPSLSDLAFQMGQLANVPINTLYGLYSPGKVSALQNANENLNPPPKDDVARALAGKYATKGVDQPTARTILDNKDFQAAVQKLTTAPIGGDNPDDYGTQAEWDQWLKDNFLSKGKTRTYEVLRGEYLSRFPRS